MLTSLTCVRVGRREEREAAAGGWEVRKWRREEATYGRPRVLLRLGFRRGWIGRLRLLHPTDETWGEKEMEEKR